MSIFSKDPLQIINFLSYGNYNQLHLRGRALEDEDIKLESESYLRLLVNSWKRFESDEIKHCPLQIELPSGQKLTTQTDKDGYFHITDTQPGLGDYMDKEGFIKIKLSYLDPIPSKKINNNNLFEGEMLIPHEQAEYAVISDIDDTILHTGVVSKLKWRLLINTFLKSPTKRKALDGASTLYQAMHLGKNKLKANPIFYVSHSPWNMYRYLELFLKNNEFPKGPILLRSMRTVIGRSKTELAQKHIEIIRILKTYPQLKFVLIGDAGEYDTDIYMDVVQHFPERIKAIIVRSVSDDKRMQRIKNLANNYKDVPICIPHSNEDALDFSIKLDLV